MQSMNTQKSCDVCYGKKTVMGLGCMDQPCGKCLGLGYLVSAASVIANLSGVAPAIPTAVAAVASVVETVVEKIEEIVNPSQPEENAPVKSGDTVNATIADGGQTAPE